MQKWYLFEDPRFALQFEYPAVATDGEFVERVEAERDGMVRVHVLAPRSREVYFEVSKYDSLRAESEYRRHKENLHKQHPVWRIGELKEMVWNSRPAYEYSIEWDQSARRVLLVELGNTTYRIIYNPHAPINLEILSKVRWLSLP